MSELDDFLAEADSLETSQNETSELDTFLAEADSIESEDTNMPEPVKVEEANVNTPALQGYTIGTMGPAMYKHPTYNPDAKETINGTEFMKLVDENGKGSEHDLTKYELRGQKGLPEGDMQKVAEAMRESEESNRVRGREFYKHFEENYWTTHTPESLALERDGIEGNEMGFWGKLGGHLATTMGPVTSWMDGMSMKEKYGQRYNNALQEGIKQHGLEQAEAKLDKIYDERYAVPESSSLDAFDDLDSQMNDVMSREDFKANARKQFKAQRRFEADYKAGLVNQFNKPILSESEYNNTSDATAKMLGKLPYEQYVKDMYADPKSLSDESIDNILGRKPEELEYIKNSSEKEVSTESGLNKVHNAISGEITDELNKEEYDSLMKDQSFGEEMKLLGTMLMEQPEEATRQFGIALVEQLPNMIIGSKGMSMVSKVGSIVNKLKTAGQLRYLNRASSVSRYKDVATAKKTADRFGAIKKAKQVSDTEKKLIARPTLAKLFKQEELEDIGMMMTSGALYEAGKGSKYGMKELGRDLVMGVGFSSAIAPIRHVLNRNKPTWDQVNRAGKNLYFTEGMSKHPEVGKMVKMFASLSDNIAFNNMRAKLDMKHSGSELLTKADVEARGYAGEAGVYDVAGWNDGNLVTLTKKFDESTVVEESSHFLYNHIKKMADKERKNSTRKSGDIPIEGDGPYNQLNDMITVWESQVWHQAKKLGLEVPEKSELFAQVLVSHMGHGDKLMMKNAVSRIDMPDELLTGLRRIWSDDPIMQGKDVKAGNIDPLGNPIRTETPEMKTKREKAETEANARAEERANVREEADVSKDMDSVKQEMADLDENLHKTKVETKADKELKVALNEKYKDLLREERVIKDVRKQTIVPTVGRLLDMLEANPSKEAFDDLIKEIDTELASPENKNIHGVLRGYRDRATSHRAKAPKGRAYQLKQPTSPSVPLADKQDAPMFYSKMRDLIGPVIKQKMELGQLKTTLLNKGISKEQIEWMGLDDLIKSKSKDKHARITPEEFETMIELHSPNLVMIPRGRMPKTNVKELSKNHFEVNPEFYSGDKSMDAVDKKLDVIYDNESKIWRITSREKEAEGLELSTTTTFDEAMDYVDDVYASTYASSPRYQGQYRLEGGANYEEHVLAMPNQVEGYKPDNMHFTTEGGGSAVGWARSDDRNLIVDGNITGETRYIDEVQSKRHQDASDKGGYKESSSADRQFLASYDEEAKRISDKIKSLQDEIPTDASSQPKLVESLGQQWEEVYAQKYLLESKKMFVDRGGRLAEYPEVKWTEDATGTRWESEDGSWHLQDVTSENRTSKQSHWSKDIATYKDGKVYTHSPTVNEAKKDIQRHVVKRATDSHKYAEQGIPDAPFKSNWADMVMKQELRLAVDDGIQTLTWSTGAIQAKRWSHRGQVAEVNYFKQGNAYNVSFVDEDGNPFISKTLRAEELSRDLSPEMATHIKENATHTRQSITGDNMDVWDEDMKAGLEGFYDRGGQSAQNITRSMEKFAKKYGSKVEEMEVETGAGEVEFKTKKITEEMFDKVVADINNMDGGGPVRRQIKDKRVYKAFLSNVYDHSGSSFDGHNVNYNSAIVNKLEYLEGYETPEVMKTIKENLLRDFGGMFLVSPPKTEKVMGMRINKKMKKVAQKGFDFQLKEASNEGHVPVSGKEKGKGKRKRLDLSLLKVQWAGGKSEQLAGAPDKIKAIGKGKLAEQKKAVVKLANQLEKYAKEGVKAKYWYEDSSDAILTLAHGNKDNADVLARLVAMTSQQDDVHHNFGEAIRLYHQYMDQKAKGVPPKNMKFSGGMLKKQMSEKAKLMLTEDTLPTGPKISEFYKNLMVSIDETIEQGTTNDTWMLRAFGYAGGTTDARHAFMTETMNAVANRMGIKPYQLQAQIWTSVMTRWNQAKPAVMIKGFRDGWAEKVKGQYRVPLVEKIDKTTGEVKLIPEPEKEKEYYKAMLEATPKLRGEINPESYSYANVLNDMEGRFAWEAVPSVNSGFLKGAEKLPYEKQMGLQRAILDVMTNDDGENIILKEVGLLEKNKDFVQGIWEGETNPSTVWEVPLSKQQGLHGAFGDVDDDLENMMDVATAIMGYFTKQEGVGWNYMQATTKVSDANAVSVPLADHLTKQQLTGLEVAFNEKFKDYNNDWGGPIVMLPNHDGVRFRNLASAEQRARDLDKIQRLKKSGKKGAKERAEEMTDNLWPEDKLLSNKRFQKMIGDVVDEVLPDIEAEGILMNASGNLKYNSWGEDGFKQGEGYENAIRNYGGSEVFRRLDGLLSQKLSRAYEKFAGENGLPFNDPTIPRNQTSPPPLGKEGTDGAIEGTAYQLKRHTETPPDRHSGNGGQSFDVSSESAWDAFRRTFQDRFGPVARLQKTSEIAGNKTIEDADTYLSEVVYYGRSQMAVENADETIVAPMIKFMKKNKITTEEVDDFLYARHAPERNRVIAERNQNSGVNTEAGSGMSNEDSKLILENFQSEGKIENLQKIGNMVKRILDKRNDVMIESGLLGEEYLSNLPDFKYYVPLRGFEDPHHPLHEQGIRPDSKSKGFATNTKERKMLGRKSRANSPLATAVSMMNTALVDSEKNLVGKTFLNYVLDNSEATYTNPAGVQQKMFEVDPVQMTAHLDANGQVAYRKKTHMTLAPNEFTVMTNGQQHVITIAEPNLANAMKQMGTSSGNMILRGLQFYNRFLAMMSTTMSPEFLLSNFSRDAQTATVHLSAEQGNKVTAQVTRDVFPAMAGIIKQANGKRSDDPKSWTNWATQYKNEGGQVGWFGLKDVDEMVSEMQAKLGRKGKWGKTRDGMDAVAGFLGSLNEGVENSFRLASFKNLVENGVSPKESARVAKELTVNFNRRGEAGQVVNGLYLFFNASLQGTARMVQAMATNRKLQGITMGIVGAGYANGLYNYAVGGENENGYKNFDMVPSYETSTNMVFLDPSEDGGRTKIPMPYGYNLFWGIGQSMAKLQHGSMTKGEMAKDLAINTFSAFNPLGTMSSKTPMGAVMKTFMPTVGQAGLQHVMNENFAGSPLKPEQAPWGPQKPEHEMYFKTVRGASKKLAKGLSDATGATIHQAGDIDVSPEVLDHYFETLIGGVGNFATNLGNAGYTMYNGELPDVSKTPFLRKFRATQNEYWSTSKFRDINSELGLMVGKEALIKKHGSEVDIAKLAFVDRAKELRTELSQLSKSIREQEGKGAPNEKINKLKKARENQITKFLRAWREDVEGKKLDPMPKKKEKKD